MKHRLIAYSQKRRALVEGFVLEWILYANGASSADTLFLPVCFFASLFFPVFLLRVPLFWTKKNAKEDWLLLDRQGELELSSWMPCLASSWKSGRFVIQRLLITRCSGDWKWMVKGRLQMLFVPPFPA